MWTVTGCLFNQDLDGMCRNVADTFEARRGRRVLSATESKIPFSVSSDAPGVDVYYGGDSILLPPS